MDWSLTHLEGLKDICKHQVQINQPLPPEVLMDKSFSDYLNDEDSNTASLNDTVHRNGTVSEAYTPEFLE